MSVKLMENTDIGTFRVYRESVFLRNRNNYRVVPPDEVTDEMRKCAGMGPMPKKAPEKAPEVEKTPEVASTPDPRTGRPDTSGWTEDQLREFTQDRDIPTHPKAKSAGFRAAIDRHFDELKPLGDD